MITAEIRKLVTTCLPTRHGMFRMILYAGSRDGKEHAALVKGNVQDADVLVRVHSECFTGDIFNSRRCDCGEQLESALEMIGREGAGVLIYLRQEGRGIGLLSKLHAYNLQDAGFDTVDANLLLGFGADERTYTDAAFILKDLKVGSVRLLTNNPRKIEDLKARGITVTGRVPLFGTVYPENRTYLKAKKLRLNHLFEGDFVSLKQEDHPGERAQARTDRPFVTVCYAQSIDGSIAAVAGRRLVLSGMQSLTLVHRLRAAHDAILVGIGTVLADNPCLTVRHVPGRHPQPVIVDTHLRLPSDAFVVRGHPKRPWIAAGPEADPGRQEFLESLGARVLRVPVNGKGRIDIPELLSLLRQLGVSRLMVEGGARIIGSFLEAKAVDRVVVTVSPQFVGGIPVVERTQPPVGRLRLLNLEARHLGEDIVLQGDPAWEQI